MGELTVQKAGVSSSLSLPSLLEFHSPTAALSMVAPQRGARGVMWVVVSLAGACMAASGLIPIDKVVSAPGKVVAETATTVVQPLETAIVRSIEVKEGQTVKKGDLLARLDPTFATADLTALQSQVASLDAEVTRLQAEADGVAFRPKDASPIAVLQGAIFAQRQAERGFKNENYNQKINSLQSQVQRALSDKNAYTERLAFARDLEAKRMELEKLAVGSQIARLEAQNTRVEAQRALDSATSQLVQSARDLQAMQAERDAYNQQWRGQVSQDLNDQSRKLSDAREQLNKASLRRQLVELRAEQDSVVQSISKVSPGSVMQSGEQFFTLTPVGTAFMVEANIPGGDAGFVHPGNTVTLKFDTFPFAQYGYAEGTIQVVSPDAFTGNPDDKQRGSAPSQSQPQAAYYRTRVSLDTIKLHDTPANFRITPGMPVTADIKVGERTLMSYLLGRVLPVAMDGMREP